MAFVPLVPQALNISQTQGLAQEFQTAPVLNLAGAAVDLSAWTSLTAELAPPSPVPYGANAAFGTVTGSNLGVITLLTSTSDLASVPAGSGKLIIKGKPTSGDTFQIIASGTVNVLNGA